MTNTPKTWMIRSPRGTFAEDWEEIGIVAIGYGGIGGDMSSFHDWKKAVDHFVHTTTGQRWSKNQLWQVARFSTEPRENDRVITYDTGRREYLYGLLGNYRFEADSKNNQPHIREVKWQGRISRDDLSKKAKNGLGATLTIFTARKDVADEIHRLITGESPAEPETSLADNDSVQLDREDSSLILSNGDFDELNDIATEQIKDRVMCLDDSEMEHLVAGLLRAMGYKTRVSPVGSDRGRDVIASPDGLGFEHPRIVVEVKHRRNAISAPDIRSLSGALTPTDRGLFVSTGGFTKDARYEADRANPPITLLDSDELVQLLTANYENTDPQTKALVHLKPLYWPA
ncbi:MAG: restriction endonuclease [Phycisphaerales bacterium]|nr:restriction endonuclease [Phycisphaerales bacterium]